MLSIDSLDSSLLYSFCYMFTNEKKTCLLPRRAYPLHFNFIEMKLVWEIYLKYFKAKISFFFILKQDKIKQD